MATLSGGQHKQLISAALSYLEDLRANAPAGVVADSLELNNAIRSLGAASNLMTPSERAPYSIQPHTLASLLASLKLPVPGVSQAASPDFEAKFAKYLVALKDRGYFSGAVEGTAEYQMLVDKARAKLLERSEGAGVSGVGASSSAGPSVGTVVSDEVRQRAEALKTKGNEKMTAKQFAEAIELYTEAIALIPTNAIYYANRAAAHSQVGNHELAIEDSKNAIKNDPKYVKAYSRLGLAYFTLGKFEQAIKEGYEPALALEPNNQHIKDSLNAARQKLTASPSGAASEPAPAGQAEGGNLGNMFQNLMGAMGGGNGGNGGGAPDLGAMFSNPNFMQMAQQMAQSPQFQQMAQQLSSNPDLLNNLGSMLGGGGRGGGAQQ
jgi:tetratricopeptide (TPR) repeat protein